MLLDDRTVQRALKAAGDYTGEVDGIFGGGSQLAAVAFAERHAPGYGRAWTAERVRIAVEQEILRAAGFNPGAIDGMVGPDTQIAREQWQNASRDVAPAPADVVHQPRVFPRQADMRAFYGEPGTGHTLLRLPYPMRLAWDKRQTVSRITINAKCAESAGRAFAAALAHYGHPKLQELNLDLFGGCFANRPMRGGKALSTHAYAAAIDINPEANQLRWGRDRAAMAKPECAAYLDAFAAEGWISLGRERNFDWMHCQAARL